MSEKHPLIVSSLRIEGRKGLGGAREVLTASNTAFTSTLAWWASTLWQNTQGTGGQTQQTCLPWKHPSGKYTNDTTVSHVYWNYSNTSGLWSWPGNTSPSTGSIIIGAGTSDRSPNKYYYRNSSPSNYNSSFMPFVIASVGTYFQNNAYTGSAVNGFPSLMSIAEVPGTQIGNYFPHPLGPSGAYATTTTAGNSFVNANTPSWATGISGNNNYNQMFRAGVVDTLRIQSGTDKGIYHIKRHYANQSTTPGAYVTHMDGSTVSWNNSATPTVYFNNRAAYGNEGGVIALSAGSVTFGGTFAPGASRNSYMLKLRYDKSGNTTAGTTQGSYWFSLKPYTHGYDMGLEQINSWPIWFSRADSATTGLAWFLTNNNVGLKSYAFDPINQRLWFASSDGSTYSGIGYWLYKTQEGFHEVANTSGNAPAAALITPAITMTSTMCYSVDAGSDGAIYAALYSAASGNAGLVVIKPDLTTSTYNNSGGGCPGTKFIAAKVDKTKYRGAADASFSGTNHFLSATGAFTTKDLGRVIKITGGANAGTYKISAINSGTDVTVVVPSNDGAVTWANNALTNQTWNIGDRIYCFFNDATTNNGKLYYMESTLLGTWLQQTVTMTNGKQCGITHNDFTPGYGNCAGVDPKDGTVYWVSTDTANQINQYVPGASTVTSIVGTDLGRKNGTDASMSIGGNTISAASGNFTSGVDLNRPIVITGGANAGTYKISVVNSTTQVTVTTPTGGAVSWPSTLNSQTWATVTRGANTGVPGAGCFLGLGINPIFNELWVSAAESASGTGLGAYRFDTSVTFNASNFATDANFNNAYQSYNDNAGAGAYVFGFNNWETNLGGSGAFYDTIASFCFAPDGKLYTTHWNAKVAPASNGCRTMFCVFNRETDTWGQFSGTAYGLASSIYVQPAGKWNVMWMDPYGSGVWLNPAAYNTQISNADVGSPGGFFNVDVNYQYINSAWTPKEAVRGPLPAKSISDNSTYATGLKTKPLHSTADALIYGVTVQFTQTAGTSYNDFVGRFACTLDNKSDGSTSAGTATSATFTGSGFVAADAGRYLRLESGSNQGVYKITAYLTGNTVTITVLNGTTFTLGNGSSLNYSVWDMGDPTGASGINGGPETGTIMLSNGFGKDNTQDVNGVAMDFHAGKTVLADQTDSIKFAIDPPGPSAVLQTYWEANASDNYGIKNRHNPLPSSALTNNHFIDGLTDRTLDNAGSRASGSHTSAWFDNLPGNQSANYDGLHFTVDLGRDVEVGTVLTRRAMNPPSGQPQTVYCGYNNSGNPIGLVSELDTLNDANVHTDGVSSSSNTFSAASASFTANDVGSFIKIIGGSNAQTVRISAYTSGTQVSVTKLDGTAVTTWNALSNQTWVLSSVRCTGSAAFSGWGTIIGTDANAKSGIDATMSSAGNTITFSSANFSAGVDVGRCITISGGANAGTYRISAVTSTTNITVQTLVGGAVSWPSSLSNQVYFTGTFQAQAYGTFADYYGYSLCTTSGNFMGSAVITRNGATGSITLGGNVLTDAGAGFSQTHVGYTLNITSGSASDVGWYRIISVVNGTSVTVAPLNALATGASTSFLGSSSSISFTVNNGVQDGDLITIGSGLRTFVVMYVQEPQVLYCWHSFQNQTSASYNGITSNQAWACNAPVWNLVKMMNGGALSRNFWPNLIGNKTFLSNNAKSRLGVYDDPLDFYDLSDLTTAKRTGRYWKVCFNHFPHSWYLSYNSYSLTLQTFYLDQVEMYDTSGKNLLTHQYNRVDLYDNNANFMRANISRVDWIQSSSTWGGNSYNVSITGTSATATKFLGYRVRKFPAGGGTTAAGGNNIFTASAAFFIASDVGRLIYIPLGANAGYFRILSVSDSTHVTVVNPDGTGVTLTTDGTQRLAELYEGIASGDYLAVTTGGVSNSNVEYQISSINNALTTITLVSGPSAAISNQPWEIRRRASNLYSTAQWDIGWAGCTSGTYALSTGDVHVDSSGHFRTAFVDQTAYSTSLATAVFSPKADGATTISTGTFTGSDFCPDDVGRVLVIQSGADKGNYKISVYTSASQVTVVNLYTGAAVSFSANASSLSYIIKGDRRLRVSRYTAVVRA